MDDSKRATISKARLVPSQRLWLAVVLFTGELLIPEDMLNIGIVCMVVDSTGSNSTTNQTSHPTYSQQYFNRWNIGVFHWSKELQGLILNSAAIGYVAMLPFGGLLATRFGPHKVLFTGSLIAVALRTLTPGAALINPYVLIATETCRSLATAVWHPSCYALWSSWIPDDERSKIVAYTTLGPTVGTLISTSVYGVMCQYVRWDVIYYIYGPLGFLWCLMRWKTTSDTPRKHPRITKAEKDYIEYALADKGLKEEKIKLTDVPWKKIFTSRTVWAVGLSEFAVALAGKARAMMTFYVHEVLKLNVVQNGLYSSLPNIARFFGTLVAAAVADHLIKRGVRMITVRKVMTGIGYLCSAVIGCFVGFISCHQVVLVVFVMTLWEGLASISSPGGAIVLIEYAPRYSGIVFSLTNFLGHLPNTFSASIITSMTANGTQEKWRTTYIASSGIFLLAALFYMFVEEGTADWAKDIEDKNQEHDEEDVTCKETCTVQIIDTEPLIT